MSIAAATVVSSFVILGFCLFISSWLGTSSCRYHRFQRDEWSAFAIHIPKRVAVGAPSNVHGSARYARLCTRWRRSQTYNGSRGQTSLSFDVLGPNQAERINGTGDRPSLRNPWRGKPKLAFAFAHDPRLPSHLPAVCGQAALYNGIDVYTE